MQILRLAFGSERTRIAGIGLLGGALMISFGIEGPILAKGVASASIGLERPDLAVGLLLVTVGYVWAGISAVQRVTENLLVAAMLGRRRLIEATLHSDLTTMEHIGAENVLTGLTAAPEDILATAPLLARGFRTLCFMTGTLVVLASLAWQLFAVMAAILLIMFSAFALNHRAVMGALSRAGKLEAGTRQDMRALVLGFKELRLNAARRALFLAGMHQRANAMLAAIAYANRRQTIGLVLQSSATLAASGICVFVVPNVLPAVDAVTMITAAVLISGISIGLVRDIPIFVRGEAAIGEMEALHAALRPRLAAAPGPALTETPPEMPATLSLQGVSYQYPDQEDESGFAFGPVDIEFPPATITFILGGNSSGKTTLIKLLAGLYVPGLGEIRLGDDVVSPAGLRESVSAIFADPYIFDRLYGWPDADPSMVNGLLTDMGIIGRTRFVDGRFTSTDLSTGQRKRLAWVVAMIESRQILLLDQWAADQDPEFREHFYRVLLPALRAAGRTVIAVTNDDRYYDAADRLIRFDDGLVVA